MLVLGRKLGEYVVIGDNIKIKIVKSENGDLRLAIDAPKDVKITRGEVWEEQQKIANYQTKLQDLKIKVIISSPIQIVESN